MLRQNKKDIQSKWLRISGITVAGLLPWSGKVLGSFVRLFTLPDKPGVIVPPKEPGKPCVLVPPAQPEKPYIPVSQEEPEHRKERPSLPARCIVFSDTDNDVTSVRNTLRFTGILNEKDELAANLEGINIFHTGDLIDKKNPDPAVVDYWQSLQKEALEKGCHVKLIAGNHEQEVWQKIQAGEKIATGAKQTRRIKKFVASLDLFHVAGPVLFIHGYPTVEFLKVLLHFKEITGKDLNCFNEDHYKKVFRSVNAMRQYAYVRDNRQANYLLYDVADASRYYRKQGRVVGAVLEKLSVDTIVHGHRPQRSGVQVDYEFGKWIPKVRMVGNDTMVRNRGIGATVIRSTSGGALDMVFINTKTASKKLRKKVQQDLRASLASCAALPASADADLQSAAQG